MKTNNNILLAFYGDDFTGSTDALEFICRAGANAMLFIEPPTVDQLKAYPQLNAYGVAGKTRAMSPAEMEPVLLDAFEKIKATSPAHVHYKVCSTFDSSATVGSIGKAIDCGAKIFESAFVPVLGGTPALGRYCVFGNLFAKMGIGSDGEIFRLDRHPSMSKHPVTPANESDLRLHLSKQTNKKIGLINVVQLDKDIDDWEVSEEVVLIDSLYEHQLVKIGVWLQKQKSKSNALFSVGSSAVEMALGKYWNDEKILLETEPRKKVDPVTPLLIVSGSCSPITAGQITYAKANGFEELIVDAIQICEDEIIPATIFETVNEFLLNGKKLIVHTGDKKINILSSEKLGTALGNIVKQAVQKSTCKRVIVCGGDTSSYAARAMEIEAVEMIASVVSGAPLCKVHSYNENMHGLEINFKGGQVGGENYFTLF